LKTGSSREILVSLFSWGKTEQFHAEETYEIDVAVAKSSVTEKKL
jgi:hypothetical protein